MDAESLERLAIERAIGALPPEVEALLDEYLARDPAAAALVDDFAETARLAKEALGGAPAVLIPPFPLGRMQRSGLLKECATSGLSSSACEESRNCTAGQASSGTQSPKAGLLQPAVRTLITVAASLVLGIGLGVLASRYPTTGEPPPRAVAPSQVVNVAARPAEPAADRHATQFWSRERLAQRALAATPARQPRLVWTSPIRPPIMEVSHGTLDSGT